MEITVKINYVKIIVRECKLSSIKSELTYTEELFFIPGPLLHHVYKGTELSRNFAFPTRPFRKKPPGTLVFLLLGRRSESTWAGNKRGQVHSVITTFPLFGVSGCSFLFEKLVH